MDLLDKIDMMVGEDINEGTMKAAYDKIQKTIQTSTTKEHAIAAAKLIDNYFNKFGSEMAAGGKIKLYSDSNKMKRELKEFMKKRHGVDVSNKELGLS